MSRDAKPGELREITAFERIEKLSKRPESRIDVQRMLEKLSPAGQAYVRHLIMSGPSSIRAAAKALESTDAEIEAALVELETALAKLK